MLNKFKKIISIFNYKKLNFKYFIYALLLFAFILLLMILIKSKTTRAMIFISIFVLINSVLSSYKRFIKLPIEIEFMTLGIVVITSVFGIKAGLIFAILGGIISFSVGYNINPFSFPMLLGYILMAFLTFFMQSLNFGLSLFLIGLIASLANNLFVFLFYHFVFNYDFIKNISFSLSNFIINLVFFISFLDFLLRIVY